MIILTFGELLATLYRNFLQHAHQHQVSAPSTRMLRVQFLMETNVAIHPKMLVAWGVSKALDRTLVLGFAVSCQDDEELTATAGATER